MKTSAGKPQAMPQATWELLVRLQDYTTFFSLIAVCNRETPGGVGRFELYKQFSYLQLHGYIQPLVTTQSDRYQLTPLAWEQLT